jgi:hypothetical protein
VYNGTSDVFPPRKNDQAIANRDRLILDRIGETDIVTAMISTVSSRSE